MKTLMYFHYTMRTLLRGGSRTLLAIFCIAVGVMAIVSLQLAGFMLQDALTSNIRVTNGGDIAVVAQYAALTGNDLDVFEQLKDDGKITNYTEISSAAGSLTNTFSLTTSFSVEAIDPDQYPLVTPPIFIDPPAGSLAEFLTPQNVVVSQKFVDTYHKKVGDTITLTLKAATGAGPRMQMHIAGIFKNTGVFSQSGVLLLLSQNDYQTFQPEISYTQVVVTTSSAQQTKDAVRAINQRLPLTTTRTAADLQQSLQSSIDNINRFLQIAGLLALLIGGVGIINTMRVLLTRRKIEIAMLKTIGYRHLDLYLLFGLEASLLGLVGGLIGTAAATGISYIVRDLIQNLDIAIPFVLNGWIIAGGVLIGLVTALIFGLMPIVQAANTRPLNVIRELIDKRSPASLATTAALLLLLSILFCSLATILLKDIVLGIEVVYGTFAGLLLLSLCFGLVVLAVSKLPIPEHLDLRQIIIVLIGLALALCISFLQLVFGIIVALISLAGLVVALVPRSWQVSIRLALRNIGRQRTRTTTTLLAIFIGLFAIGLIVTLGQNLQAQLGAALARSIPYNIIASTKGTDSISMREKLKTIPGLTSSTVNIATTEIPIAVNGEALERALPAGRNGEIARNLLSGLEGPLPDQPLPVLSIVRGRNLQSSDRGTQNVVITESMTDAGPYQMHLKVGTTITYWNRVTHRRLHATVVGIYKADADLHLNSVLTTSQFISVVAPEPAKIVTITYMKIDNGQLGAALKRLEKIAPTVDVQNLADIGDSLTQRLNSILIILVAISSLSVLAAVIIIANAVALAMLERRRELGILKAVGYTSGAVLSEIMVENGLIGALGAILAMLVVTLVVTIFGSLIFNLTLSISAGLILGLVAGSTLLALATAALVAYNSAHIRPIEVLRYE